MTEWRPRLVVVQAVIELPDGTTKEASVHINPDLLIPGSSGGVFRGARVFCAHERKASRDIKVQTTEGPENVWRGSTLSYAGDWLDMPLESPQPGVVFVADRLMIIPPKGDLPGARIGQP